MGLGLEMWHVRVHRVEEGRIGQGLGMVSVFLAIICRMETGSPAMELRSSLGKPEGCLGPGQ